MLKVAGAALILLGFTVSVPAQPATPDVLKDLAPTGKVRAAINYGNQVLVQKGTDGPRGVSVDLSRELAKRLGVPVELVTFEAAGKAFEAAKAGAVDILLHRHRAGAGRRRRVFPRLMS